MLRIDEPDLAAFRAEVETETRAADYPRSSGVAKNILIYDGAAADDGMAAEWTRALAEGPGVFVIRRAFRDLGAVDAATAAFRAIIAEERAQGIAAGDHFAKAGANDRVWNSLQKLCLRDPGVYARYMANPVIDLACRAWLGPGYQMATQLNVVRPGGKAQQAHRDYHLGFMKPEEMPAYPAHVHAFGPMLILQGGVAHCDMSVESGTTKLLPHSQRYLPGYVAATRPEFRAYFEERYVQLPLEKGDAIFFSPALFHAAGENRTEDVIRTVNLIQTASAFARHMEAIDRTAMSRAVYPHLAALGAAERAAVIAATADGYAFPTNLDTDPPLGGLAPESQQTLLARAVEEGWSQAALDRALGAQAAKRAA